MSYYNQGQAPVGVPPPHGYPPEGYPKDAYPPPGYPPQGYPPPGYPPQGYPPPGAYPPQGYPPPYAPQYGQPPPPQQQSSSSGCLQGWRLKSDLNHSDDMVSETEFRTSQLHRLFGCAVLLLPARRLLLKRPHVQCVVGGLQIQELSLSLSQ
ncbi:Cysteine-rich and transmembrane domain-containing protein WIH2 [Cucurbita argyrosperma subsp. argyrosperma]|nr:Cysteine-rich and transmembrane domain-containing protein WIH2 [Cucurbita argyrosperma subsp. argyrosperma]